MKNIWNTPLKLANLQPQQVHVWLAKIPDFHSQIDYLKQTLSPVDLCRVQRFILPNVRDNFIITRGILRLLLACYLNSHPSSVAIINNPFGKPQLANNSQLNFNISHSAEFALFAFAYEQEVGVDIEAIKPNIDWNNIARRFFSTAEYESLQQLPERYQLEAFFNCWTRKEAFIKAIGQGLHYLLKQFDVTVTNCNPECTQLLLASNNPRYQITDWQLFAINSVPANYTAAVALNNQAATISHKSLHYYLVTDRLFRDSYY